MEATALEKAVIGQLLKDVELNTTKSEVNFEKAMVIDREFTGVGFLTEFERSQELKLFADDVSLRWGKVGARLNASKLETGYVVYVDNGYLTAVEGYSYGDEWPEVITSFTLYEFRPGMELGSG
ncbi:MAG: hypothetical protein MJE77_29720 [Proteobacteria bacterium]|nr:hypothetical protein [Pseudomonadota bacterium]